MGCDCAENYTCFRHKVEALEAENAKLRSEHDFWKDGVDVQIRTLNLQIREKDEQWKRENCEKIKAEMERDIANRLLREETERCAKIAEESGNWGDAKAMRQPIEKRVEVQQNNGCKHRWGIYDAGSVHDTRMICRECGLIRG